MKEKINRLLKEFIAIPSVSCTRDEIQAAEYVRDYFSGLEYFKMNPEFYGLYDIPDDPYDRKVAYGFIKGNSDNTVVLMGHIDVVGVEDYGEAIPLAYTMGEELERFWLEKRCRLMPEKTWIPANGNGAAVSWI